ncbi:flagellar biosynthesis protein FlhB [Niveibacterium sp. COAC-50]|uniref:EscU/YscU/HrcU family type III secretion system export apparatus switch protein n=1 Tax=Niveibacterium sp. COAC-50 TaxID=2729384 RepID=UPI0015555328|nr:EscU/YscU/HrcU family type III secretion system export apparatus switch protein [Niveibacterium sp. COAC-50]
MANQEELDKSEQPSPHKLERARERGSFVRSQDTTFALVLAAAAGGTYALGERTLAAAARLTVGGLRLGIEAPPFGARIMSLGADALALAAPLIFLFLIAALVGAGIQARGVLSAEPLKPDFSRLNPAQGLKRLFSLRALLDLGRSLLKLAASGALLGFWLHHRFAEVLGLAHRAPRRIAAEAVSLVGELLSLLALLYVGFALLDWLVARWDFMRQMRMSKRELKDEFKEREGDPRIKQRQRELRNEVVRRARSLARVPAASAVVTNPTHFAVCIEYDEANDPAPRVTAKGRGIQAWLIRSIARRACVPVVENPPLARALFRAVDEDAYIAAEHYGAVAKILLWVAATRPRKAGAR